MGASVPSVATHNTFNNKSRSYKTRLSFQPFWSPTGVAKRWLFHMVCDVHAWAVAGGGEGQSHWQELPARNPQVWPSLVLNLGGGSRMLLFSSPVDLPRMCHFPTLVKAGVQGNHGNPTLCFWGQVHLHVDAKQVFCGTCGQFLLSPPRRHIHVQGNKTN